MPEQEFASYEDFFTFYLHEHSDARNRAMHAAGTLLGLVTLIVAFAVRHPCYALLGLMFTGRLKARMQAGATVANRRSA